jgi:hypothetical protein
MRMVLENLTIRVAASRPKALAMALWHEEKTIAKLRLTLPPRGMQAYWSGAWVLGL